MLDWWKWNFLACEILSVFVYLFNINKHDQPGRVGDTYGLV